MYDFFKIIFIIDFTKLWLCFFLSKYNYIYVVYSLIL